MSEVLFGVNWTFTQTIRDTVLEVLSGVQGENSVKIIGADLAELEAIGQKVVNAMRDIPGIQDVGLYRIMGQCNTGNWQLTARSVPCGTSSQPMSTRLFSPRSGVRRSRK